MIVRTTTGYVESWGRGIEKMRRECANHDAPAPLFDTSMSGLMLTFKANPVHLIAAVGAKSAGELFNSPGEVTAAQPESQPESMDQRVLALLANGPLVQQYRLTEKGQALLVALRQGKTQP